MGTVVDGIEQVDPDEAQHLLEEGALLLDVREDGEWEAGHAPDAVHVALGVLAEGHAGVLPRDNRIVAVCRVGGRSHQAAQFLVQTGYDVVNLAGGMKAWDAAGKAVVTDAGESGQVV